MNQIIDQAARPWSRSEKARFRGPFRHLVEPAGSGPLVDHLVDQAVVLGDSTGDMKRSRSMSAAIFSTVWPVRSA